MGHMLSVFLTLEATAKLFFQVVISVFHAHHECVRVPIASHHIDNLFHSGHSSGGKRVSCHCDLHFIDDYRDLHIFSCTYHIYLLFKCYPLWRKALVCLIAL